MAAGYVITRLLSIIISPLMALVTAIYFSGESYGYYAVLVVYQTWALTILEFGVMPALQERIEKGGQAELSYGLGIVCIQTILCGVIYYALCFTSAWSSVPLFKDLSVILLFGILFLIPAVLLQPLLLSTRGGKGKRTLVRANLISLIMRFFVWCIGVKTGSIVIAGGLSNVVGTVTVSIIFIYYLPRFLEQSVKSLIAALIKSPKPLIYMFSLSARYGISTLLFQIYFYIPIYIWQLRDPDPVALGAFVLFQQILNLAVAPLTIIVNEIVFGKAFILSDQRHNHLLINLYRLTSLLSGVAVLGLFIVITILSTCWGDIRSEYVKLWFPWLSLSIMARHFAIVPGFNLVTRGFLNERILAQIAVMVIAVAMSYVCIRNDVSGMIQKLSAATESVVLIAYVAAEQYKQLKCTAIKIIPLIKKDLALFSFNIFSLLLVAVKGSHYTAFFLGCAVMQLLMYALDRAFYNDIKETFFKRAA